MIKNCFWTHVGSDANWKVKKALVERFVIIFDLYNEVQIRHNEKALASKSSRNGYHDHVDCCVCKDRDTVKLLHIPERRKCYLGILTKFLSKIKAVLISLSETIKMWQEPPIWSHRRQKNNLSKAASGESVAKVLQMCEADETWHQKDLQWECLFIIM